jgi:hypothetical protein
MENGDCCAKVVEAAWHRLEGPGEADRARPQKTGNVERRLAFAKKLQKSPEFDRRNETPEGAPECGK